VFRLGYNTNGLAHHRPIDALHLLADLGYEGVALTPDVGSLDPYDLSPRAVRELRAASDELGLTLAVETGARFVLDARRKHRPTLLENEADGRELRIDFLVRSLELAAELGAETLSLWSGAAPEGTKSDARGAAPAQELLWSRLCDGLVAVLDRARALEVRVAFEPEPGMFVERPSGFGLLLEKLGSAGDDLGLCLDVGHLLVTGDLPVAAQIHHWAPRLVHVHLDDIRAGIHEHCMFGTGDLDLSETLSSLLAVGYDGMAAVELSRDSHRGPQAAQEAMGHLKAALTNSRES
jgi:sugar phosphate isomerase/epimerase